MSFRLGTTDKRMARAGGRFWPNCTLVQVSSTANKLPATSQPVYRRRPLTRSVAACSPCWVIHFNSSLRSVAVCQRSSGFFARHFSKTRSSTGVVVHKTVESDGGLCSRIERRSTLQVGPIAYLTSPRFSLHVFFLGLHHVSFGFSSHFTTFKSNTAML
jgi:hypothetical protein